MALKKQLLDAFVLDNHIQVICIGISNVDVGHIHAPCPCLQRCDISRRGGEISFVAGGLRSDQVVYMVALIPFVRNVRPSGNEN